LRSFKPLTKRARQVDPVNQLDTGSETRLSVVVVQARVDMTGSAKYTGRVSHQVRSDRQPQPISKTKSPQDDALSRGALAVNAVVWNGCGVRAQPSRSSLSDAFRNCHNNR